MVEHRDGGNLEMFHKSVTNPTVSIEKIITINAAGGVLGTGGQHKYTLIRKDNSDTIVTDGDPADDLHPMSLVKLKQLIDNDRSSAVVIRIALDNIKKAGEKLYQRAALTDFDLCINFEYSKSVLVVPPNNTIPAEIPLNKVRT
ncbi:hypothetical protein Hanom_Chr05g00434911 [Helianthus anomalus]